MSNDQWENKNVLGGELLSCSENPMTGFFRTGCCETGEQDVGLHTVCVRVTQEFLNFSQSKGNDLSTPHPEFGFSGLKPGDRWCLCAGRWREALLAGAAPQVYLRATHAMTLHVVSLDELKEYSLDLEELN